MAFLEQLKSLTQLPGQLMKTRQSKQQAEALQRRLPQASFPAARPVQPTPAPRTPAVAPVVAPAPTLAPAPAPAPVPPQNGQVEAIRKGLTDIEAGVKKASEKLVDVKQEEDLRALEEAVGKASEVSPEETETQSLLSNLIASRELGLSGIKDKPIAMDFITGQLAALERRAATQSIPLTQKISLLQSRRQASLDTAKTRLGISEARSTRAKETKKLQLEEKQVEIKMLEAQREDEDKVADYIDANKNQVVVFRNKKTGKIREVTLGKVYREPTAGYTEPYDLPGVGKVQRNTKTGDINVLKAEKSGSSNPFE